MLVDMLQRMPYTFHKNEHDSHSRSCCFVFPLKFIQHMKFLYKKEQQSAIKFRYLLPALNTASAETLETSDNKITKNTCLNVNIVYYFLN